MIGRIRKLMNRCVNSSIGAARAIGTRYRRRTRSSDVRRWSEVGSLSPIWDARTRRIAAMVSPGQSVLEFGAGRRVLEAALPAGTRYTPSDIVDRGPGTLVCDLNARPLQAFAPHDVAVFSGVLEYVNDVPALLVHLRPSVRTAVIASYAVLENNRDSRRASGWVNDYSKSEFVALFHEAGFACVEELPWENQVIFRFACAPAAS